MQRAVQAIVWLAAVAWVSASLVAELGPADPVRAADTATPASVPPRGPDEGRLAVFCLGDPLTSGLIAPWQRRQGDVWLFDWAPEEIIEPPIDSVWDARDDFVMGPFGHFPPPQFRIRGLAAFRTSADVLERMAEHQRTLGRIASHELLEPVVTLSHEPARFVHERLNRMVTLHLTEAPRSQALREIERQIDAKIVGAPRDERLITFHGSAQAFVAIRCAVQSQRHDDDDRSAIPWELECGSLLAPGDIPLVRVYPVRWLRDSHQSGEELARQVLDDARLRYEFAPSIHFEPAGAIVVAATAWGHERIESTLDFCRGRRQLPTSVWPPRRQPESPLQRVVELDQVPRSVPQFIEYLARTTGLPVFDRRPERLVPPEKAPVIVAGDGRGGTLGEQLRRILRATRLSVVVEHGALAVTRPGGGVEVRELADQLPTR